MPGYSHRSLTDKLGISPGQTVLISGQPADIDVLALLDPLPETVRTRTRASTRPAHIVLCFAETRRQLHDRLPHAKCNATTDGAIWVVWPKKSSQRFKDGARDLTEDVVREQALASGLVDVKVCAVDETWSGLKLVRRLKDR